MNSFLCEAIRNHLELELRYNGYNRVVNPYACGLNKDGETLLRCFQVAGGSVSGERTGWKLLKVEEITSMHATVNTFEIRTEYSRGDKGIFSIDCQA